MRYLCFQYIQKNNPLHRIQCYTNHLGSINFTYLYVHIHMQQTCVRIREYLNWNKNTIIKSTMSPQRICMCTYLYCT